MFDRILKKKTDMKFLKCDLEQIFKITKQNKP